MTRKYIIFISFGIFLLTMLWIWLYINFKKAQDDFDVNSVQIILDEDILSMVDEVVDFESCVDAGYPVMESDPLQCSAEGKTYTEKKSYSHELIKLEAPLPGALITSPFEIRGEARGYWFFEASFPILLTDSDGAIIAQGFATAEDEWMTEDFVPFYASLEFDLPEEIPSNGKLILQKDNPSALSEYDDVLEIPVVFE